ncbi:MAG: molybdopterin oxidoreductase family protein [Pseudomonadota bacterium]|nr:molybdopterin oxidoreductase family protein [Pseudomonadota bacterium]MEC7981810.1 molybdopterin oxidoreductase family protein [Pseudomonadota bacterium]MEC8129047.1 molybdopterin oxidoreductase family protein [Pseudomonadota bacterium]MEC8515989.1 molybdopterin oxidoreductase family protein [Pseudomonadota bacterium]MEC8549935.1 molybdopterin oxidoreductase family protein [Pseudomonadota bacterium]
MTVQPKVDTAPHVSDEVRKTTCYMCACRCGINVHLRDGKIRYIEGNRDHPVNQGVLCAKGSAGIMQHYSPARLRAPMKRVGPRGSGQFEEISWDEALGIATDWLAPIRKSDPKKLAFFTGRDQSQALTGWWAQQFGTPNFAAHGGFCSVNMAAGGIYTLGGAFWEFGSPDWDLTELFVLFGVAEDHDSNPIKMGLGKLKTRGARVISVNPVQTGYAAISDDWYGVTPGTDGLLILSLVRELMRAGKVDIDYLSRYTNAPWLVIRNPGRANDGLFLRDGDGTPMVLDRDSGKPAPHTDPKVRVALHGEVKVKGGGTAVPAFMLMTEAYLTDEYAPETVAPKVGISAARIRELAADLATAAFEKEVVIEQPWTDWKGERHERMIGRPVSMHAMRGISAHSNGFQTCRALHMLQLLLGSVEAPGGFRFKPPYPKPPHAHPKPAGRPDQVAPEKPLGGAPLGYVLGPEDLIVGSDGVPQRIDKAYSWDAPMSAHGMMHMVISNAVAGDPYPVDVLFMYMANMAWNSSMNTRGVMEMLTETDPETGEYKIPKLIYSDAYSSEMVAYADLILPDTTYLERHDAISLLDRPICEADAVADAIRWPVIEPDRDVRGFQSVLLDLGARLGLPGMVNDDGSAKFADYGDYIVNHERKPGIGPLAGFRGEEGDSEGRGEPNRNQLEAYIENGAFWQAEIPEEARYFKQANAAYQQFAVDMGFYDAPQPYAFQIYVETLQKFRLAAEGHGDQQPPDHLRERIRTCFTPLPSWYAPFEGSAVDEEAYPLHALTQRPMAMYHSWGSQNAWLRQIHGHNPMFVSQALAAEHDLADGDWIWVTSHHGRIRVPVAVMAGVNDHTIWTWNAIGKRKGAWQLDPDAPEAKKGFLLNHLIHELLPAKGDGMRWSNSDPITGQAAWFDLRVQIEKAAADEPAESWPQFDTLPRMNGEGAPDATLRYGLEWTNKKNGDAS